MAIQMTIGEFQPGTESWVLYTERLEQHFLANDVQDADKKRAFLLSSCGAPTYQLIRNLTAPDKPSSKSFDELVKLVQTHHQPPPSITVQRFNFHSRTRREGESMSDFVAHLRQLSEHCAFGESLNDMLRDRIVCGCNDTRLQRQLLAKPSPLSFEDAFSLAQAHESAEQNAKDLQKSAVTHVHVVKPEPKHQGDCHRCGGKHPQHSCRFRKTVCNFCKKTGHIAKVCRTRLRQQKHTKSNRTTTSVHQVTDTAEDSTKNIEGTGASYNLFHFTEGHAQPIVVTMGVSGAEIAMEVDTGASVSIISEATYNKLWSKDQAPQLQPSHVNLETYTGEQLSILGVIEVTALYEGQQHPHLNLLVVKGSGPSLLGRDWLRKIRLNWKELHLHHLPQGAVSLDSILQKHSKLFAKELGLVKKTKAKIHIDPQSKPQFYKARPIPYALRDKVNEELQRLEQAGIIEPVEFSEWAAPIVPVLKRDGTIRICGDYKLTVNQAAKLERYPLPKIEDLFTQLSGGKRFTKLDLAHAYQQIPLAEDSKSYLTINTLKGLYRYNRLPFGVHSAPSIFQRTIEGVLRGIPKVAVYIDDILITGDSEEEHLQNLEAVLSRLEEEGLRLKKEKCEFMLPKIEYLGHVISAEGLHPAKDKIRAILEAPAPSSVAQLRSFLGMVNYYGKFLPQLSSLLAPLYSLLQKQAKWHWGPDQEQAFTKVKHLITSSKLLVHYDPVKELVLSCDASPYGVGAVLSHIMEDGSEKPIAFASGHLQLLRRSILNLIKRVLLLCLVLKSFTNTCLEEVSPLNLIIALYSTYSVKPEVFLL